MSKKPHTPRYKRGTVTKNGRTYGRYPDGTLYRIYPTANRPFVTVVDVGGSTYLRIRQATEAGYTDCPTAPEDEEGEDEETEATAQSIDPDNPGPLILLEFD